MISLSPLHLFASFSTKDENNILVKCVPYIGVCCHIVSFLVDWHRFNSIFVTKTLSPSVPSETLRSDTHATRRRIPDKRPPDKKPPDKRPLRMSTPD